MNAYMDTITLQKYKIFRIGIAIQNNILYLVCNYDRNHLP